MFAAQLECHALSAFRHASVSAGWLLLAVVLPVAPALHIGEYECMVVQLDFTPDIEVLCIMFQRYLYIFTAISTTQHVEYFNFRCRIQLDHPVHAKLTAITELSKEVPKKACVRLPETRIWPSAQPWTSLFVRLCIQSSSKEFVPGCTAPAGGITQPRTKFFGQLCT